MEKHLIGKGIIANETKSYITIRDIAGRIVKVPRNVTRIVAVGPSALRLVVYVNATDKVVGIEGCEKIWRRWPRLYIKAHPELLKLPSIGTGGS